MAFRIILSGIQRSNLNLCRNQFSYNSHRNISSTVSKWKQIAFNLSDIGEGIREVIVKEWYIKEGDVVQQFDNLCEVQSDKASVTITSRYDGKILKIHHAIDEIAFVGKPLIDFDVAEDPAFPDSTSVSNTNAHLTNKTQNVTQTDKSVIADYNGDDDTTKANQKVLTTPAVRRIAQENSVDLTKVRSTGPHGRILKSDVLEYLNMIPSSGQNSTPIKASVDSSDRVEKLKDVRKAMFKTMTASLKIPHFTYCDEVNATALVSVRQQLKAETESNAIKLTFTPFFIKAASQALHKYPIINSFVDGDNESIVYKTSHNICIAMATPNGLVVPNIKDCQNKTIAQIARELSELLERGRNGKLTPADFTNGTFSLSNIGVVGGTYTKPCITPPQVAIGAIGTTHILPRFVGNTSEIEKAHILNVSWSADHRVIDGVTMAGFSNEWKRYIENPHLFILQ